MPAPPAQPPLIASLANGMLVLCGLLVAGCMTLLASDSFKPAPMWAAQAGFLSILSAILAGISSIVAIMHSINFVRRVENGGDTPDDKAKKRISSARKNSIICSEAGFLLCGISALLLLPTVVGFLLARGVDGAKPGSGSAVQISSVNGHISVDGQMDELVAQPHAGSCTITFKSKGIEGNIKTSSTCN